MGRWLIIRSMLGILFVAQSARAHEQWTWFFSKKFSAEKSQEYRQKNQLSFFLQAPQFSQLILSWNAFRPEKGHIRFWVQARNSKTRQWYGFHHMIDWGKDVQRSYISVDDNGTGCYHVRLEVPRRTYADAFRIKIEAHDGADLGLLKGLQVCVSDLAKFSTESASQVMGLKSVSIAHVPKKSQMVLNHPRASNLCSPTSLSMLLGFLKQSPVDPLVCAEKVYDSGLDSFGSWPFNVAHAFEACEGAVQFGVRRLASFSELHKQLANNIPVMVSVRGELKGAAKPYNDGHLLVVVGWDAWHKKVLCYDPAFDQDDQVEIAYGLENFLHAWGRSRNLAYVAEFAA